MSRHLWPRWIAPITTVAIALGATVSPAPAGTIDRCSFDVQERSIERSGWRRSGDEPEYPTRGIDDEDQGRPPASPLSGLRWRQARGCRRIERCVAPPTMTAWRSPPGRASSPRCSSGGDVTVSPRTRLP